MPLSWHLPPPLGWIPGPRRAAPERPGLLVPPLGRGVGMRRSLGFSLRVG